MYPASWYPFCTSRQLRGKPISKRILGRQLVAFRTASARVAVMDARCVHMGADLGRGRMVGESIQCPFHNWEYGLDGHCVHIPATAAIPHFARQVCYPVKERHGCIFFFNGPKPLFPLPFFFGCEPKDLVQAKPYTAMLDCPWYMVGANAVDLQHFKAAHDRRLKGSPAVDFPATFAHRTSSMFSVSGVSLADRLTRCFAGDEVTIESTDWAGTLMLVRATFGRTRSYGMLASLPLDAQRTLVQVTVFVRRSINRLRQTLFDPINAWLRRLFIKKFLQADVECMAGIRYNPHTLIEIDRHMSQYFQWLGSLPDVAKNSQVADDSDSSSDLDVRGDNESRRGREQRKLP